MGTQMLPELRSCLAGQRPGRLLAVCRDRLVKELQGTTDKAACRPRWQRARGESIREMLSVRNRSTSLMYPVVRFSRVRGQRQFREACGGAMTVGMNAIEFLLTLDGTELTSESQFLEGEGVRLACGAKTVVLLVGTHCLAGGIVPLSVRFLLVVASSREGILNFNHAGRFNRPLAANLFAARLLRTGCGLLLCSGSLARRLGA